MSSKPSKDEVCTFISFLTGLTSSVKIAHWTTCSYAAHVALDELHSSLQSLGDAFVEAWMGRYGRPAERCFGTIKTVVVTLKEDKAIKAFLRDSAMKLQGHRDLAPDLASIRDDMLAALSKALYLLQLEG